MIAIDWGTSRFRAFRVSEEGSVVDARLSARGAGGIAQGRFREALDEEVGDWIEAGERKVLMSGMVGSRRGWREVAYVEVPAGVREMADGVERVDTPGIDARIVPGLQCMDGTGVPDVMRGEETEIAGCLDASAAACTFCLPGTHTKWVRVRAGKIVGFSTFMTGDLYAAVKKSTILAQMTGDDGQDMGAFEAGVLRSRQQGGLTHHLFGIRTAVLTGRMEECAAAGYLSGLLIGHEVKDAGVGDEPVHLVGDAMLCGLYSAALASYGVTAFAESEGAALRGLTRIAGLLRW